jgi:hypothetical protein
LTGALGIIPRHNHSESALRCLALLPVLLGAPAALFGQDSLVTDSGVPPQRIDSTFGPIGTFPGPAAAPLIRYLELRRSDVFDSAETGKWYARLVNGLHIMTRPAVIERELLLGPGEPWDSARAAETARNLRRLGVFRQVSVDSVTTDSGLVMRVTAKDGWSTQADLRFRSTGGQTDWQTSLIERNLLGTATRLVGRYRHTPDRNLWNAQFVQPRLFARSLSLALRYEKRSDGNRSQVAVERPFFALSDHVGISTLFEYRNERVFRFFDGFSEAGDSLRRRYVLGSVEAARALRASPRGYLRVGMVGQVRRDDFAPWPAQPASSSVTGSAGVFLEWKSANFALSRGFLKLGQDEDVDLSRFVRLQINTANEFLGYRRDGVGGLLQVRLGTQFPAGFAWVDGRVNGVLTAGGVDSGSVTLGATGVFRPVRRHLAILHADVGWLKNPIPSTEFDLGFARGPRGFPIHAFTGDRTYFTTAEYRVSLAEDLFKSLALGVAGFADHGGAWYSGSPRRTGTDVGLGLRLSPSRAADANPTRLDLAYRFKNDRERAGWVFVIASGLVFSLNPRGGQ